MSADTSLSTTTLVQIPSPQNQLIRLPRPVGENLTTLALQVNQANGLVPFKRLPETFTDRGDTVVSLWKLIREKQVVHIRGTPATGKSTLARLLQQYVAMVVKEPEVYYVSWPENFDRLAPYSLMLNKLSGRTSDRDWLDIEGLLIVDEAQASYSSSLWNDLIKFVELGFGLKIALFSSYGSASALVEDASTSTPLMFEADQRVSLKRSTNQPNLSLLLSRDEFQDLVHRRCESYGFAEPFLPPPPLIDRIFEITQGHASASTCALAVLSDSEVSIF